MDTMFFRFFVGLVTVAVMVQSVSSRQPQSCQSDGSPEPVATDHGQKKDEQIGRGVIADFGRITLSKLQLRSFKLGVLEVGSPTLVRFTLENDSDKEIVVRGIETSCGCTKGTTKKLSSMPGGDIDFEFQLSPGVSPGAFGNRIRIRLDELEYEAELLGEFSRPVSIETSRPLFLRENNQFQFWAELTPVGDLSASVIESSIKVSEGFSVDVVKKSASRKGGLDVLVISKTIPSPEIASLDAIFDLSGDFVRSDGSKGSFSIPVHGFYDGNVSMSPKRLRLRAAGDVFIGKAILRSSRECSLTIEGLKTNEMLIGIPEESVELRKSNNTWLLMMRIPVAKVDISATDLSLIIKCNGLNIVVPIDIERN